MLVLISSLALYLCFIRTHPLFSSARTCFLEQFHLSAAFPVNELVLLDLSNNRLVGALPNCWENLKQLIILNLNSNSLSGEIPHALGSLSKLQTLHLRNNNLLGELPLSLKNCGLLQLIDIGDNDLSNNNLSGKIPSSAQLHTFDESSYAGNDGLCGFPLELCPDDAAKPSVNGEEKGDGSMSLSLLQEAGISMVFGSILGFWGVVGTLVLKKSWRITYFGFLDAIGDWMCVTTFSFSNKFK